MFLCDIKANFCEVHFSSNSLLTFLPFSDSRSPRGIKDNIDTSVPNDEENFQLTALLFPFWYLYHQTNSSWITFINSFF